MDINTGGGAAVGGDAETGGGGFVGRDRYGPKQNQSVTMLADRDVAALLYSVERETQVIHREIGAVRSQLQHAIYVGLFLFLIVFGVTVFIGDRQVNGLADRLHDVELQMQRIERQLQRNTTPYYTPGDLP